VISPVGAIVWLGVVFFGLKLVIDRAEMFNDQSQALLAPGKRTVSSCLRVMGLAREGISMKLTG
jgi:hypothetical protein